MTKNRNVQLIPRLLPDYVSMRKIFTIAILGASLLSLTACSFQDDVGPGSSHIVDVKNEHGFTHSDVMFAESMISHHEQAIDMSKLALTNTTTPQILSVANDIIKNQSAEIATLKTWLQESKGFPKGIMMDNMEGMGMMDEDSMKNLSSLKDTAFDKEYILGMIDHHQGALAMATDASTSTNQQVKDFAENVISDQTAEIEQMKALL